MKHPISIALIGAFCLLATCSPSVSRAATFTTGDSNSNVNITGSQSGDTFAAGQSVSVDAPISGELFVAGNTVTVGKSPGRSLFAAGRDLRVSGSGYDAFVAGSSVTLSGQYAHDVYVAASTVTILSGTVIGGDLRVSAQSLTIAGTINGNVSADVQDFTLSAATVGGDVSYTSSQDAQGLGSSTIHGTVQRHDVQAPTKSVERAVWSWLIGWLATAVLGAVIIALLRHALLEDRYIAISQHWGRSAALGLAFLIGVPILACLVAVTIIGWKLALVLGLLYVVGLLVAGSVGTMFVGYLVLNRLRAGAHQSPWEQLLVGSLLVSVLVSLPIIGGLLLAVYFVAIILPLLGTALLGRARE